MKILVKLFVASVVTGILLLSAVALYVYLELIPALPAIGNLEDTEYKVPLRIYDKNEYLLAEYGEHRRVPVKYDEIPPHVEKAFLAAEDDQFWEHYGVDPYALMAAVYELVTTGNKTRGGSTITMQVARNFFLSSEKTYLRKVNEILLALKIEKELDKKTILELYLNKIFLGNRAYGIVAAAQVYYGKTLDKLSVAQAAMIAGLPKAPSRYNPIINPARALIRRDHIIRRMGQLGFITDEEYQQARAEPVTAELHRVSVSADARYVTEMVRSEVFQQYGEQIYSTGMAVYTTIDDKLQITANKALRKALLDYDRRHGFRGVDGHVDLIADLDPFDHGDVDSETIGNLKKAVIKVVDEDKVQALLPDYQLVEIPFAGGMDWAKPYINENRTGQAPEKPSDVVTVGDVVWVEQRDDIWLLAQIPEVEGAIVSLDPSSGAVQALVGGFDYFHNKFNRAVQAKRQPGSNYKPFIYSAALEKELTAASLINDAPVVFDDDSLEATWRPENYSGRFYGPTRLREALVKSRNLVSIRILQSIGLKFATQYAQKFGFKKKDMPYDLSLALGSGAFSPLEIVRSYAVFANGGYLVTPYYINRIESSDGSIKYENTPLTVCQGCDNEAPDAVQKGAAKPENNLESESEDNAPEYAPRVISPQNAYIVRSILREVVQRGTAVRAKALGRKDIAGKTGTTNDQHDAWFSGFNDQVVTTAWVGFDSQKPLGSRETGGRAALPMWIDYMREALNGMPTNIEEQPVDILTIRIDSNTGQRATKNSKVTRFEIFQRGTEPPEVQMIQAESSGGNKASVEVSSPTQEEEVLEDLF